MSEDSSNGNHPKDGQPNDNQGERLSILTVARTWWPWCLGLIFVLTIVWTALVAWTVIEGGDYTGISHTIVAIIGASAPGEFLIIIYSLMIVTALDTGGGFIVITKRYLEEKWLKPQREKFREEGREEGRREGIEWNRRRLEAEAKGISFDEPYPGMEDEPPSNNGTAVR